MIVLSYSKSTLMSFLLKRSVDMLVSSVCLRIMVVLVVNW